MYCKRTLCFPATTYFQPFTAYVRLLQHFHQKADKGSLIKLNVFRIHWRSVGQKASLNLPHMSSFDLALGEPFCSRTKWEEAQMVRRRTSLYLSKSFAVRRASVFVVQKAPFLEFANRYSVKTQNFFMFVYRPKDAMRALKKRLSGNRNYREVMLGLTVRSEMLTLFIGFYKYQIDLSFQILLSCLFQIIH